MSMFAHLSRTWTPDSKNPSRLPISLACLDLLLETSSQAMSRQLAHSNVCRFSFPDAYMHLFFFFFPFFSSDSFVFRLSLHRLFSTHPPPTYVDCTLHVSPASMFAITVIVTGSAAFMGFLAVHFRNTHTHSHATPKLLFPLGPLVIHHMYH